jgi:hypothetical protein
MYDDLVRTRVWNIFSLSVKKPTAIHALAERYKKECAASQLNSPVAQPVTNLAHEEVPRHVTSLVDEFEKFFQDASTPSVCPHCGHRAEGGVPVGAGSTPVANSSAFNGIQPAWDKSKDGSLNGPDND